MQAFLDGPESRDVQHDHLVANVLQTRGGADNAGILPLVTEVHIQGEVTEVVELEDIPFPWPIAAEVQELEKINPQSVVNAANLGALKFEDADIHFRTILKILNDLRLEDWDSLPTGLTGQIPGHLNNLLNTVREMIALSPASDPQNYQNVRSDLQQRFSSEYLFFRDEVWPRCLTARIEETIRKRRDLIGGDLSTDRIEKLQQEVQQLEETVAQFRELAPLVEAQREVVGGSGATKLSHDFDERAKAHAKSFFRWGVALVTTVAIGGGAAVAFVYGARPADDAGNAEIVTHVLLDLLVLGLIVFLVRFVAIQTRAHRHMQFVAKNKANALSTFRRIVQGQDDVEVRAQVALALAQAVFKSDDGIFSDSSSDTVTVIERMGAVVGSRLPGGGGS